MSDGIIVAGVQYKCRLCGAERKIYVKPVLRDGRPTLDFDSRHRTVRADCTECAKERTHVALETLNREGGDSGD